MYILEPIFHKTIWGGTNLTSVYGEEANGLAHLYSLWCKPDSSNIILNGKNRKKRLYDVLQFPLTIALVDAAQDLSIQVHPNDETALALEGDAKGKREAWYFIKSPDKGYIYNGIINDIDFNGDVLSNINKLTISDGDYVFVSPGTVHAITAGSFIYEIEEGSDLTYRIFDYYRIDSNGNERELHIEKAKAAIDKNARSFTKRYSDTPIEEPTFATELKKCVSDYQNTSNTYECITFIGDTDFVIDGVNIFKGMSIILEENDKISFSDKHADIIIAKVNVWV